MYQRCFSLALCLVASSAYLFVQGQEGRPQTISSAPADVKVKLQLSSDEELAIKSKVVFTPTQGNADDTLTGELACEISEESRRLVSRSTNQPLVDIPGKVVIKEVIASFEKQAKCPELRFEFTPIKINVAGVNGRSERFVLVFSETEQELSIILCLWAKRIQIGRGTRGIHARLNRVLRGEQNSQ